MESNHAGEAASGRNKRPAHSRTENPDMAGLGRPTDYTSELADEICRRLVAESMLKICMDDHMPSRQTVYNWLGQHPDFFDKYVKARELQSHHIADVGSYMSIHGVGGDPQAAAVQLNAVKWTAGRLNGKYYGDKQDLNIGGQKDGEPLTVVIKQYPAPVD